MWTQRNSQKQLQGVWLHSLKKITLKLLKNLYRLKKEEINFIKMKAKLLRTNKPERVFSQPQDDPFVFYKKDAIVL